MFPILPSHQGHNYIVYTSPHIQLMWIISTQNSAEIATVKTSTVFPYNLVHTIVVFPQKWPTLKKKSIFLSSRRNKDFYPMIMQNKKKKPVELQPCNVFAKLIVLNINCKASVKTARHSEDLFVTFLWVAEKMIQISINSNTIYRL